MCLQGDLDVAAKALASGQVVGVPTETVYGLAVRLDHFGAIRRLLKIKERQADGDKILSLMVSEVGQIGRYAELEKRAFNLALRHFPGELTMVLSKKFDFRHEYFDYFDTIGVRIPDHEYMLKLLNRTGALLVTSANSRGEAPCLTSGELSERMPEVDMVVKGRAGGNLPSTVLDFSDSEDPVVLRQGGLLIVRY